MRHVGHVPRASTQAHEESGENGCEVVPTDAEESDDAESRLVVPGPETAVAALGTGEGGVALPPDLSATQAKDPYCLRYMQLVNTARAPWPLHLDAAPVQPLCGTGVLCVQIDDVVHRRPRPDYAKTGRKSRRRPSPHRTTRRCLAASHTGAPSQLLFSA